MSLMAGIYSFRSGVEPDPASAEAIQAALSRRGDKVQVYQDRQFFLAKVDLGLFDSAAFFVEDRVSAATGELLLDPRSGRVHHRDDDLRAAARCLASGDLGVFRRCVGTFSLCHYDPASGELLLATDRLGSRAVYYAANADYLVFSNNLRVFERLPLVPKRMDVRGVTEILSFGNPLADRTPYFDIRNLRGGCYLSAHRQGFSVESYFRWRDVPPTALERSEFMARAHEVFLAAIATRAGRAESAVSLLSGGLDSRVVVGGLRELGKDVYALTFTYSNLKDGFLAERYSRAVGSRHFSWPVENPGSGRTLQARLPRAVDYPASESPRFPYTVFSGDGGSVGLGFVYMDEAIVGSMREGRPEEAVERYLRNKVLPHRIINHKFVDRLDRFPARGVREELNEARTRDPAKDFHVFLMENDQRRHLHFLYEDLDEYRIEFLLPFLDGRWLELIASAPVDWFLLHRFYNDWLKCFPEPVWSTPWQTYPGHLPCPVADEGGRRTQWELTKKEHYATVAPQFRRCRRALFAGKFPSPLLDRRYLLAALLLHGARIRNYAHFWKAYDTVQTYFDRSQGMVLAD